jgi:poly(3-hydroxybutyrate) depolymerase
MVRLIVATALALVLLGSSAAAAAPGQMQQRTFSNAAGTRTYYLYEPAGGGAGKPLMVWLHGCGGPGTMQAGHALAKVAEERGFTLVFPVQPAAASADQLLELVPPSGQHRGAGEPSILAGHHDVAARRARAAIARVSTSAATPPVAR